MWRSLSRTLHFLSEIRHLPSRMKHSHPVLGRFLPTENHLLSHQGQSNHLKTHELRLLSSTNFQIRSHPVPLYGHCRAWPRLRRACARDLFTYSLPRSASNPSTHYTYYTFLLIKSPSSPKFEPLDHAAASPNLVHPVENSGSGKKTGSSRQDNRIGGMQRGKQV